MSLSIRQITQKQVWETFLLENRATALFQSWLWGEREHKLSVKLWRFGLYEREKLVGIFQVHKVTARRGSFLHVRHGPVFIKERSEYWEKTVGFLKNLGSQEQVWFIRVSPQIEASDENGKLFHSFAFRPSAIHAMDGERCWVLDISASEEEIMKNMRKTTRYEIHRAESFGVDVKMSSSISDFKYFQDLYDQTSKRHGFVQHRGILEEFETFVATDEALLFLGSHQGKVMAAAIVLFYNGQAIYHHGASESSKIPASYLVQWEAIKEAKKRGMILYNFWGIAPENNTNHPWRGHSLFKKGFGGREVNYIHAHDLPISPLYAVSRTIEKIRRFQKGY